MFWECHRVEGNYTCHPPQKKKVTLCFSDIFHLKNRFLLPIKLGEVREADFEWLFWKIEKIGSVVLIFLECLKPFFCGILDVAQPNPDFTSSGPRVN